MPAVNGDSNAQTVWGAQALTSSFADNGVVTVNGSLNVLGYTTVAWYIEAATLSTVTGVEAELFFRYSSSADWIQVPWEATSLTLSLATTTLVPRVWTWDTSSGLLVNGGSVAIVAPAYGQLMKIQLRMSAGTVGTNSFIVRAQRFNV